MAGETDLNWRNPLNFIDPNLNSEHSFFSYVRLNVHANEIQPQTF